MKGPIPNEIGNLCKLKFLDLSGLKESDALNNDSASEEKKTDAELTKNEISGEIPASIGTLKDLEVFRLIDNDVKGRIPVELCECTNLVELLLNQNEITEEIPKEIGNLVNLRQLWLYANSLQGEVPTGIGDCISLEDLRLGLNKGLSGAIPGTLKKCTKLYRIILKGTSMGGTIPWNDSDLPNLTRLHLPEEEDIQIKGKLGEDAKNVLAIWKAMGQDEQALKNDAGPNIYMWRFVTIEKGRVTELKWSRESLNKPIPSEIGNLDKLRRLHLANNSIPGHIPEDIGNLKELIELNLADNTLDGPIPASLGNCKKLKTLKLKKQWVLKGGKAWSD